MLLTICCYNNYYHCLWIFFQLWERKIAVQLNRKSNKIHNIDWKQCSKRMVCCCPGENQNRCIVKLSWERNLLKHYQTGSPRHLLNSVFVKASDYLLHWKCSKVEGMVTNCFINQICWANLIFTCKKIYFKKTVMHNILQFWKHKIKNGDA